MKTKLILILTLTCKKQQKTAKNFNKKNFKKIKILRILKFHFSVSRKVYLEANLSVL